MAYADLDTGRMLIAEPGQPYRIRATEEGLPVPPADGRWSAAPPPGPPPDAHPGPGYPVTVLPAHAPQGGEF